MKTIHAIYADGVFRPVEKVDLPERSEVEFEPRPVGRSGAQEALSSVYDILDERFQSGEGDTAARHDEHQP
jgi:predicted DNA-binding antitoxin AbrB/MazE fold protein